jgi:hypothetical protein
LARNYIKLDKIINDIYNLWFILLIFKKVLHIYLQKNYNDRIYDNRACVLPLR